MEIHATLQLEQTKIRFTIVSVRQQTSQNNAFSLANSGNLKSPECLSDETLVTEDREIISFGLGIGEECTVALLVAVLILRGFCRSAKENNTFIHFTKNNYK